MIMNILVGIMCVIVVAALIMSFVDEKDETKESEIKESKTNENAVKDVHMQKKKGKSHKPVEGQ